MQEDDYSYENLKRFAYIDCVIKETIRYYPPVNRLFTKVALEDGFVNEIPIKKGTLLNIQTLGVHYSEQYYKNPTEYRPERWVSECDNIPTYAFNGFSGGPRTCIGKHLAQLEAKISLIKFMKRYKKIELPTKNIKMKFGFVYDF